MREVREGGIRRAAIHADIQATAVRRRLVGERHVGRVAGVDGPGRIRGIGPIRVVPIPRPALQMEVAGRGIHEQRINDQAVGIPALALPEA